MISRGVLTCCIDVILLASDANKPLTPSIHHWLVTRLVLVLMPLIIQLVKERLLIYIYMYINNTYAFHVVGVETDLRVFVEC